MPAGWPGVDVPNFSDWHDGDIVLVHRELSPVGLAIQVRRITDPSIPAADIADVAMLARQHIGEP